MALQLVYKCDCETARSLAKAKDEFTIVETKSTNGETCDYCGYYVVAERLDAVAQRSFVALKPNERTTPKSWYKKQPVGGAKGQRQYYNWIASSKSETRTYSSHANLARDLKISSNKLYEIVNRDQSYNGWTFTKVKRN